MKARSLFAFLVAAGLAGGAAWAQLHPSILEYPDETFEPRKAERSSLSNGMLVFLVENHEIPVVSVQAFVRAGSVYDSSGKEGLAWLAAESMRAGGTKRWKPEALDEELERRAVDFSVGVGKEMLAAGANTLTKESDWAIRVLADILRNPAFRAGAVKVEKARMLDRVRRRWDYPGAVASLKFSELVYGKQSPWGRYETEESLRHISRKDLKDFHRRAFVPENILLGAYGDFRPEAMLQKLEEAFGDWEPREAMLPELPKVEDRLARRVYYVPRANLEQTSIRIGHLGVNRHDTDIRRIEVMNHIFGSGGLSSRLFLKVRSEKGLAYSVGGGVGDGLDRGEFSVDCSTKPETTVEAIETILAEIERLRAEPPTEEELRRARLSTVNSFVFQFEEASDVLWKSIENHFFGYPENYWDTYLEKIRAVTAEQVLSAARKHMDPEKTVILVVGDESKFDRLLSTLGEVTTLSLE
jgi:predicted Zn-dependent peptidase